MARRGKKMGLFDKSAPGMDDPRRRRRGPGAGGYEGLGGAMSGLGQVLPHLQGLATYDYSGLNMRGLADVPGLFAQGGPAARHAQRQGLGGRPDLPPGLVTPPPGLGGELPPGIDNRNALGGPNVAPGNIDSGVAITQPGRGNAFGNVPRTQGWINTAPGGAVAAKFGYGTPEFGRALQGFGGSDVIAPGGGPGMKDSRVSPGGVTGGGGTVGGGGNTGKRTAPTPGAAGGPGPSGPSGGGRTEAVGSRKPASRAPSVKQSRTPTPRKSARGVRGAGRSPGAGRSGGRNANRSNNTPSETRAPISTNQAPRPSAARNAGAGRNPNPSPAPSNNTPSETQAPTPTSSGKKKKAPASSTDPRLR